MKKLAPLFILLSYLISTPVWSQEDYFVGQSRFMQKVNSSYLGINSLNRVGVLYNQIRVNSNQNIDNKYFFGTLSFDEKNFSLGLDVNSFRIDQTGYVTTLSNFSYIYKLQINNRLFFLPALSVGLGSSSFNSSSLVFEDQLDRATGFINTESIDPTLGQIRTLNYFDLGASFILHNESFLAGMSLKHLNRPNISFDQDTEYIKPIQITFNGAYEFNINPYERGLLPNFSFLYTYGSVSYFDTKTYYYLSQELQLGEFSLGISQQASYVSQFNLNNLGILVGLSFENFDFGILYNFPLRNIRQVFSPSVLELYLTFDFSKFRRNRRGLFKRLQTDNYF